MKTIADLTEQQWAKIHGRRAGQEQRTSRYNPYFHEGEEELHKLWEEARLNANEPTKP